MFLHPLPEIRRHIASGEYELCGDLKYKGAHDVITAEHGYRTDLASIPKLLQWWTPPSGTYEAAAIIHDKCCDALNADKPILNSKDTDGLFRRMMAELDVPILKRWIMWAAVRWAALASKTGRRQVDGILEDLPLMILFSILSIPAILPGTIYYGLLTFIDWAVTGLLEAMSLADPHDEGAIGPADEHHDGPGTKQCP